MKFDNNGIIWAMLTSALGYLLRIHFDITFMGNEKNCQHINFFFLIKILFNWILNMCNAIIV